MSDLGVVDPIKVPARVQGWVDGVPSLAWLFVGLAALDVLVRILGIVGSGFGPNQSIPSLLAYAIPRAAVVVLPAVIVLRRPTAQTDTPWVLYGAIVVAVVRLVEEPTASFIGNLFADEDVTPRIVLGMVENLVIAGAWVVLGRGMTRLNPSDPKPIAKGLANVAIGSIVVTGIVGLAAYLVNQLRLGNQNDLGLPFVAAAVATFAALGFGYFLWTLGRAFDDPSRLERATRLAGGAIIVQALSSLLIALIGAYYVAVRPSVSLVSSDVVNAVYYMGEVALLLIVVSFGVGLADPLRPMARDWTAAAE